MRTLLALLAALGAALAGRSLASACARRGRALRQAMDALQLLRIQMLDRRLPLHAALDHARSDVLRRVGERVAAGEDAASSWRALLPSLTRRGGALDCLTQEDVSTLTAFFDGLGAEQEALFQTALRELGRLEAEAARSGAEKGRLYATLGLLFGLMLAIAFV